MRTCLTQRVAEEVQPLDHQSDTEEQLDMDDTDNDLSDDELNDSEDDDEHSLVTLPSDHPSWDEVSSILNDLAQSRETKEIQNNISKLSELLPPHETDADNDGNALKYFLEEVCDTEERDLIINIILPTIVTLALQIDQSKPFIRLQKLKREESGRFILHPDFVSSILAHSFLSTSGRRQLNLNLNSLNPEATESHWVLRCYFSYFHRLLTQDTGSERNLTVLKEVSRTDDDEDQEYYESLTDKKLIRFIIAEDNEEFTEPCLKLTYCQDFQDGIIKTASPLTSEFTLKHLDCLVPFLLFDQVSETESVRTHLPGVSQQISLIRSPDVDRSITWLMTSLQAVIVGTQPSKTVREESMLRRPSVAAVTSCATVSQQEVKKKVSDKNDSSVLSFSVSDNNNSDSDLSFSLSRRDGEDKKIAKPRNKTRKKESFNDRLKAALERGNTPDESDVDVSQKNFINKNKKPVPLHKRLIKRQRSRAFNDTVEDSEEFFTATEDERSFTPARPAPGPVRAPLTVTSGVVRRPMLQDKSFDLSVASSAHNITSSEPVSSKMTSSSHLVSDSESFSSDGLGMPHLQDQCLEDLCDQLQTCLETSENSLEFRNLELKRIASGLRVRSLSESFSETIHDLDQLAMTGAHHDTGVSDTWSSSLSCPDLTLSPTLTMTPTSPDLEYQTLVTHDLAPPTHDETWVSLVWPLVIWCAVSSLPNYQQIIFKHSHSQTDKLSLIVEKIENKNLNVSNLFSLLKEFTSCSSDNADFCTFILNKLG